MRTFVRILASLAFVLLPLVPSMAASDLQQHTCTRVQNRFQWDHQMVDRVNARLQKRFGFVCDVKAYGNAPTNKVDLSVRFDEGANTMKLGDSDYYYLTLENKGNAMANGVVLEFTLPEGMRVLVTDTSPECRKSAPQEGPLITCNIGQLAGKESKKVLLSINYGSPRAPTGTFQYTATILSTEKDSNMTDNSAKYSITLSQ